MGILWQDLRYGIRMLRTKPGFALAAILSLALGIGACTSIFSVVDAVLLRSLPYPEADRIVQFREISERGTQMPITEPNFLDVRARSRTLEGVAQYAGWPVTVIGGSEPARARAFRVSSDFFHVLTARPHIGRIFTSEDNRPDAAPVAVVSYGFWQRLLGGKADLTGTTLRIDDRSYTVVGVLPPDSAFPRNAEIWMPRELFPAETSRTSHNWSVIARLRRGATLEEARAEMSVIGRQFKQEHGRDVDAVDLALIPLHEYMVGSVRRGLLIILFAVGFLLLVACANVANLLLARVTARQKEFAVRAALGATRLRLARQFITENVVLALAAAAPGVLLAFWGVDLLAGLNQSSLPRADEIGVDARALLFTLGLSLTVAVILGLVPLVRFSRSELHSGLKETGRSQTAHAGVHRLRGLLVVSQMALTLILLIGAGLLGKSFYRLLQVDPGFRTQSAVVMDLSLPGVPLSEQQTRRFMDAYRQLRERGPAAFAPPPVEPDPREEQQRLFHRQLLERLEQLPGVTAVGSINALPMTGIGGDGTFFVDNDPANAGHAEYRLADAGYFAAIDIPLVRGRLFEPGDHPESPHVAVVSRSLAQRYWPNEDPIGKRLQFGNMDGDLRLLHVVGVVGDVRDGGLDAEVRPTVYAYALQRRPSSSLSLVVRAETDAATLVPMMRQTVRSLDPELPMNFRTLEEVFSSSLDARRFSLVVFGVFASVALLLAVVGIYGVMTYTVSQRTQEIGIRMALGASVKDVLRLIMRQGLRLIVPGLILGLAGSLALTRLLSSLLYGVSATDPLTFAGVAMLLAVVALLACYFPARRAAKVDPMIALRYE